MPFFELKFQSGESSLSVRRFSVHEAVSTLYTVSVWARCDNPAIDIASIVGQPAGLTIIAGYVNVLGGGARAWSGICSYMEQTNAQHRSNKLQSTYYLRIVPHLWLLEHNRNHRIFQHLNIPDIVDKILDERGLKRVWNIDRGQYLKLEFKVQYGESDFAFINRLCEEAGIAYTYPDQGGGAGMLTFCDALQSGPPRPGLPVPYENNPTQAAEREFVSDIHLAHDPRPGAYTIRDYDFRRPSFPLFGDAPKAPAPENDFEQYHSMPGAFLVNAGAGGDTPVADDKGVYRHDLPAGTQRATRSLEAARADKEGVAFIANLHDLCPGLIFSIRNHPHPDLARKLLVTDIVLEGTAEQEWQVFGHAVFADTPFRPPLITPRPQVLGVTTVTVVGPKTGEKLDQAIHTDEFGRVRVQFPWDRYGTNDENSSVWMRVNEGWGGTGYGWLNLPRVGHEVLVTFLEGDPDRPVVAGRVYNTTHPVPYKLPDNKTVSTWKSDSTPEANGFNEFKFEDLKGGELLYHQAQKNRRLLVKHDEFLTVGHDRNQGVVANEIETVDAQRLQWTEKERHAMIGSEHRVLVKHDKRQLIRQDETEINDMNRLFLLVKDQDHVVQGARRERDEWDLHVRVIGDRKHRTGQDQSLTVYQERQEKVGQTFARETGQELHVVAGKVMVGEAPDVTVKGPGGFIRIDATGIVISGTKVDINVSGSPGHGHGSHPKDVAEAIVAKTKTGVIWDVAQFKDQAATAVLVEQIVTKGALDNAEPLRSLDLLKMALTGDVTTPPNGLILWSGGKDIAGIAADQLAETRTLAGKPSLRLEKTKGGSALGATVEAEKDPWSIQSGAWTTISKRLGLQASGEVNAVVSYHPLSETAIFREEVKVLASNPKVTSIKVWAMKTDAAGNPVKGPDGKYILEPISLKEVLKKPPPKKKP